MQISNIYVQNGTDWAKKVAGKEASTQEKKEKEKASKAAVHDKVSISEDAGKSNSAEALVKAMANALPETREEKIAVAKERIESGHYNTPEFSNELAERLVDG